MSISANQNETTLFLLIVILIIFFVSFVIGKTKGKVTFLRFLWQFLERFQLLIKSSIDHGQTKSVLIQEPLGQLTSKYQDLAPTDTADRNGAYCASLDYALNNPNIKNLAISGPYGSGKSSVIKTYLSDKPDDHFLNVSLATFNRKEADENVIQRSILQQIIYRVGVEKLPDSRFFRQTYYSFKDNLFSAFIISVFAISLLALLLLDESSMTGVISDSSYVWIFILLFGGLLLSISYRLVGTIRKLSLEKINPLTGDIHLAKNSEASILNLNLDEILIFFQKTTYKYVVFEDIDRFNNLDIFVKLREVNTLINNNEKIKSDKGRVVFIYSIKDEIFKDTDSETNRVKFFDFIIPIIPYVHSSNSKELMHEKLRESGFLKKISSQLVKRILLNVSDMRLIINTHNEFLIYENKLNGDQGPSLDLNKLFSLIVIKNLYPEMFTKLNKGEGKLCEILNGRNELIEKLTPNLKEEVKKLHSQISDIQGEFLSFEDELRRLYVLRLIQLEPGVNSVLINNKKIPIMNLIDEDEFDLFRENQITRIFYHNGTATVKNINISQLEAMGGDIPYEDRKIRVGVAGERKISDLKEKITQKNSELSAINVQNLSQLIRADSLNEEEFFGELYENKLVLYLLREGHLDEGYVRYLSYFHKGSLNRDDYRFLVQVNRRNPLDYDFKLENCAEILSQLSESDFDSEAILNVDLYKHIFLSESGERYRDLCIRLLKKSGNDHLQFINKLIANESHMDSFFISLAEGWPDYWETILKSNLTPQEIDTQIHTLLAKSPTRSLQAFNTHQSLTDIVSDKDDLASFTHSLRIERFNDIFQILSPKIVHIHQFESNKEQFESLYKACFYQISVENIQSIYKHFNVTGCAVSTSGIIKSNLPELLKYVEKEYPIYVSNVFLDEKNTEIESEQIFIDLLNDDRLKLTLKVKVVRQKSFSISKLSDIDSIDVFLEVISSKRFLVSWENVIYADQKLTDNEISEDVLFESLNLPEIYEILASYEVEDEELVAAVTHDVFANRRLSHEARKAMAVHWQSSMNQFDFSLLESAVLEDLIETRLVTYKSEVLEQLSGFGAKVQAKLVEKSIERVCRDVRNEEDKRAFMQIPTEGMQLIFRSTEISYEQKKFLIEKLQEELGGAEQSLINALWDTVENANLDFEIDQSLLIGLMNSPEKFSQKVTLIAKQCLHKSWGDVSQLLIALKDENYSAIAESKSKAIPLTEYNKLLLRNLDKSGYISEKSFADSDKSKVRIVGIKHKRDV